MVYQKSFFVLQKRKSARKENFDEYELTSSLRQ